MILIKVLCVIILVFTLLFLLYGGYIFWKPRQRPEEKTYIQLSRKDWCIMLGFWLFGLIGYICSYADPELLGVGFLGVIVFCLMILFCFNRGVYCHIVSEHNGFFVRGLFAKERWVNYKEIEISCVEGEYILHIPGIKIGIKPDCTEDAWRRRCELMYMVSENKRISKKRSWKR